MTHISFLDSIMELIVGITCLFGVIYQVVENYQFSNKEMELAQQSLRQLVDKDPLTGLWNRRKLEQYIQEHDKNCTLIYLDVNNFKSINDTWGHSIGDLCLQKIAESMNNYLCKETGKFRLGGDEFLAVIPEQSELTVDSFIQKLNNKLKTQNGTPSFSVAIGIKKMTDELNFSLALEQADTNMYQSKLKNN